MSSNEHPSHTARGGGSIIALEGIDGCGKTTMALRLAADLQALRRSVCLTRRPSDGPVGCSIRRSIAGHLGEVPVADRVAMAALFAADLYDQVSRILAPALSRGEVVVSDRWYHSSLAYQVDSADPRTLDTVRAFNARAPVADLVVYLRTSPEVAGARRASRSIVDNALEARYWIDSARRAYDAMFVDRTLGYVAGAVAVVDADEGVEVVARSVTDAVDRFLDQQSVVYVAASGRTSGPWVSIDRYWSIGEACRAVARASGEPELAVRVAFASDQGVVGPSGASWRLVSAAEAATRLGPGHQAVVDMRAGRPVDPASLGCAR